MQSEVKDPDDTDYWDNAEMVWNDEFEGGTISTENGTFETDGNGWGNNELQNYQGEGSTEVKDGILWSSKYIKFYVDDIDNIQFTFRRPTISNVDSWPFSNNFYFSMNIAVGGNWGGLEGVNTSIFPATMEVDYGRVYQVK